MTTCTLRIDSIAHGGVGVARDDGRVVFVADAIPGELVEAQFTEEKKSFARAVTVGVLEASPDRVDHVWAEARLDRALAERPGGADFGHIALPRQRALKAEVVQDALRRFGGGLAAQPVEVRAIEPSLRWRTRISLHVDANGVAGPRAARSHDVVAVQDYPLAAPEIAALAPWRERFPGAERVDAVVTSTGQVSVRASGPNDRSRPQTIVERVQGREFRLDESGFWQVHRAAAETLSTAVSRAIRADLIDVNADHLDLYGGVGLLAVPLLEAAGPGAKLTTVESAAPATEWAAENLSDWVGARAVTARVERFLAHTSVADGATVVLDPPRSGAGREVVERLARSGALQIVYVACDPVAFARDLGTFREHGWDVESLDAFDLFPQTHHVELVARIVRVAD